MHSLSSLQTWRSHLPQAQLQARAYLLRSLNPAFQAVSSICFTIFCVCSCIILFVKSLVHISNTMLESRSASVEGVPDAQVAHQAEHFLCSIPLNAVFHLLAELLWLDDGPMSLQPHQECLLAETSGRQRQLLQPSARSSLFFLSPSVLELIPRPQPAGSLSAQTVAMEEFSIPEEPQLLWAPDSELAFRCEAFVDLSDAPLDEVGDAAESEPLSTAGRDSQWRRRAAGRLHSLLCMIGHEASIARISDRRSYSVPPPPPRLHLPPADRRRPMCPSCRLGLCALRPGPAVHCGAGQL